MTRPNAEHALLVAMFALAAGMFLQAGRYPRAAGLYPRLAAAVVMVGVVVVVALRVAPEVDWLAGGGSLAGTDGRVAESSQRDVDGDERRARIFAAGVGGYVALGLLVGFLYATPVFVFAYTVWQEVAWRFVVGLTALGFLVTYLFMTALNMRLASGVLVGGS